MKLKGISQEGLKRIARKIAQGEPQLTIDWSQGQTENGDQFGYITDGEGGYFFTWKDSLEAVLDSLEEDEMDRPSFSLEEARDFLESSLNYPSSESMALRDRIASKVAQGDPPDDSWDMGGEPDTRDDDWMPTAEDLVLYIDNTYELYAQKQSIQKNLIRKLNKGSYDASLAPKLWGYLVQEGAKRYVSEMGESFPGMPWHKVFPTSVRQEAAQEMANDFEAETDVAEGDLNEHFGV